MTGAQTLYDDRPRGEVSVGVPRKTDAIGDTLRNAFGGANLPRDMVFLLHKIDERGGRR